MLVLGGVRLPSLAFWQPSQIQVEFPMLLKFILYILTVSHSYRTDIGICHVARPNMQGVQTVCITNDAVAQVPSQFGGTYASKVVTTYYTDGSVVNSVDPEIIERVEGI